MEPGKGKNSLGNEFKEIEDRRNKIVAAWCFFASIFMQIVVFVLLNHYSPKVIVYPACASTILVLLSAYFSVNLWRQNLISHFKLGARLLYAVLITFFLFHMLR